MKKRIPIKSRSSGRKDPMGQKTEGTPPATNGGITKAELQELLKPLTDQLAGQAKLIEQLQAGSAGKPAAAPVSDDATEEPAAEALTLAQVEQLLDRKLTASQRAVESKAARDSYIREKLKDLPPRYQQGLGDDPAKWAAEEQSLRDEFKSTLKANGAPEKTLGNAESDGGTTADRAPVDRSKLSPLELIERGGATTPDT